MIDRIEQMEVDAKINKLSTVDDSLISGYKEPISIRAAATTETKTVSDLSPMARNILDVVNENSAIGGITSKDIAEKLGKSPESIHVRMVELRKKKLVTSIGRKVVAFQAENQVGIGP
jgi:ribosomal protein L9